MESQHAITKILLPGKRGGLLHRTRLVDFLHEHIDRKLLLISAPAGYGKSSLLIDFAHETTLPVCWYSLDPGDSDPKVFLDYIVAAIRRQFPDFGSRTLSVLAEPSSMRDIAVVVNTLVTEIYENIPGYFVLIIDDYHTVEDSDKVNQILDSFLRLLPENAHLVLASRTLPSQLTLTRLTARQEIAGLGQNDLRFSADEIRAFVKQNYAVELADKDALELAANSEGWITGILLTTHTLWQGLFQDLTRTQGPQGRVFPYLATEVFGQQPAELQRFMLDSSILDQLNPSLCNQWLGIANAADLLQMMERKNLFITRLESDETWYRYHHLFREFLESRLRDTERKHWEDLHQSAAALYASRGQWDEVIHHYLDIGASDDAAGAIGKIAKETFDSGRWTTLAKWIDTLPDKVLDKYPDLVVWRGHLYAQTGSQEKATELYTHALGIFEKRDDHVGIGKTLIRQAMSLRFQGQYQEAIEKSQRALTFLSDEEKNDIAETHRMMGISNGRVGNWDKAIEELGQALTFYTELSDFTNIALVYHDLGVANRTAGNVIGEQYFEKAIEIWRQANNARGLSNTLNSIGVRYHREGNYDKSIEILEESVAAARQAGQLRVEALALASLGDVYRDKGEYLRAQNAFETAFEIARRINEGFVITYTLNALGETLLLTGDFETAEELIHQALDQAKGHQSSYELGLAHTSLGILNYEKGNANAATEYLARAVELLEQGGAKRDSARAHLHLAQANFALGKLDQAVGQLKKTAKLGRQLGADQFVVGDGRHVLPLVKYAVSKRIGDGYFAQALEKIESLVPVTAGGEREEPAQSPAVKIEAYAFGAVRVVSNGTQITRTEWASNTAKELFFLLLAHPEGLRKEEILDALWAEVSPAKANAMFHTSLYRVRRALLPDLLIYENGLYHLNEEIDLWDDVSEFDRLFSKAKDSASEAERNEYYRQAIALYKGDYFEDSYSDWCIAIRSSLLTKYLDATYTLANDCTSRSEFPEALDLYERILVKDACREEIYQAIMRIQALIGDRSSAVRTFQRCTEVLRKELKLDPSLETRALYEQILKGSGLDAKQVGLNV